MLLSRVTAAGPCGSGFRGGREPASLHDVTAGPRWRLAEPRHGSLPLLLLALTLVTGVIDAISLLTLGRVFVANMTGNVVVTGFAIAGVPEFSLVTSLVVLATFLIGAAVGGYLAQRIDQRGTLLRAAVLIEWVLLAACLVMVSSGRRWWAPRGR